MTPALIDPAMTEPTADEDTAHAYISGVARAGVASMISNVATELMLLQSDKHTLPVTIDNGEVGGSYVCRPHSAYALYAREELDLVDIGMARWPALALIAFFDRVLRWAKINRVVHLDNWMLSTNLHGDWHGGDLEQIRRLLIERYPEHVLAIRSLDEWSSPLLLQVVRNEGWDAGTVASGLGSR